MKAIFWIPIASAGLLVASVGCGGKSGGGGVPGVSGPIADVDGASISQEDYVKRLETLEIVNVRVNGQIVRAEVAEPLSSQAMRSLIEDQVILQLAEDEKVLPTEKEIEAQKKLREELAPDFLTRYKEQGWRLEDITSRLKIQLARDGLVTQGVPEKTLADVEAWLKANPDAQKKPAQVTFRFIRVDANKTAEVDAALKGGKPFAAVAAQFSKEPTASQNNGAFPPGAPEPQPVTVSQLLPGLQTLVKNTGERKESTWLTNGNERVKIYIESKIPESIKPPSAAQKKVLMHQLRVQEGSKINDVNKKLFNKLVSAKVDVKVDYLKMIWEKYFAELKQRGEMLFGAERKAEDAVKSGGSGEATKGE